MPLTPQRLRRLVKHRERLERLQEQELAAAQRLYRVREQALTEARESRERFLDGGPVSAGPVFLADLLAGVDYLRRVERDIAARRAALATSEIDVAEEREGLLLRRRDRKAMETLLDHRLDEERIAANRADIKRIDELATTRWRAPENSPATTSLQGATGAQRSTS